jgi:DNA-binding response OmpR family regulator
MNKHIALIVEDNDAIAEGLIELVELLGHIAKRVSSKEAALKLLNDGVVPCYVLLDLEIKTKATSIGSRIEAGQTLGIEIRARFPGKTEDGRCHYVPILIVSAHDETDTIVKGILDGADGFVNKTLSRNTVPLGERIRMLLEKTGRTKHKDCAHAHEKARAQAVAAESSSASIPALASVAARPTSRSLIVREPTCFRIEFAGTSKAFKLLEGFADLARLFLNEGKEISSMELARRPALGGTKGRRKKGGQEDLSSLVGPSSSSPLKRGKKGGDSDPIYDEDALADIKNVIAERRAEGTIEALEEAELLEAQYLNPALDRRGKSRALNSALNSARVTVQKRVKAALELIKAELPELWEHLGGEQIFAMPRRNPAALSLGHNCSYRPAAPLNWDVQL